MAAGVSSAALAAAAVCGLLTLAAPTRVWSAGKPAVGYLGADTEGLPPEAASAVETGAVAGLQSMDTITAVPIPATAVAHLRSGRVCASQDCVRTAVAGTPAAYVVRVEVKRTSQADYTATLDLIRADPFAVVFTAEDRCTACIAIKLGRRIELSVAALVAQLVDSLEAKPTVAPVPDVSPPPASAGGTELKTSPPPPATNPAARTTRWTWVPWAAAGVAGAAFVGAGFAWAANGDPAGCSLAAGQRHCADRYATTPLAIGIGVVGVVAAAGAAVAFVKLRDDHGREMALGTAGGDLIVTGRF